MRSRQREPVAFDIDAIVLFRRADPEAIRAALGDCEVLTLAAGTPLLKAGEINHDVYIPLSGDVVVHLDAQPHPDATIRIEVGECVGELSAIDGKPASGLVLALSEVRVLKIPNEVFWNRLMTLPGVAASVMTLLSERLRRSTDHALRAQHEQLELQHLRKELDAARQLQASLLPLRRPIFPERRDVDVCGLMEPASRVGGDLFDAFFVRDRLLFLCIGDVSGHGIASAMFMARAIGLLRVLAISTLKPERLLQQLNERLCSHNDTNLFITLFCGFLEVDTGRLVYSNGGHCAPVLWSAGQTLTLPLPKGPLIGAVPGIRYSSMERLLEPDNVLYCYTDGVTEAQDASGQEYSERRLGRWISDNASSPVQAVLDGLRGDVAAFCGTSTLEDDFTMLAVKRIAASG